MADCLTSSGTQNELLDQLSQDYLAQLRNGELPDIEEYARLYPELANDIRELFPAAAFAEQLHAEATNRNLPDPLHQAMQLGAFRLQREIGSGGMGVVYEATQSPFTQKFAVKVLKPKHFESSLLESRFTQEAQAASRLHHPNIVPAKFYGTEANQSFLVMPMIDGVSLDKLILADANVDAKLYLLFDDICSDWKRVAELGAQVASALAHAHSHGTIHRDIKPANLILARDGNIWVTDFGLAKLCDEESDSILPGGITGTPRFITPEQTVGAADVRSDIYGLGLTLYQVITRESLRYGESAADLGLRQSPNLSSRSSIATPDLEIPDIRKLNPAVPDCLARVIMKACAIHSDSCYKSASELEFALNELCFDRNSDRRNSPRSRAILSKHQASSVAILMGMFLCLLTIDWYSNPSWDNARLAASLHAEKSDAHLAFRQRSFVTYEEPGTDLVNAVIAVSSRADDAEEYGEGTMFLDSRDLEMTWDDIDQVVGLRFAGIEIEKGVEIHSAKLCFYAERREDEHTELKIFGVNDANPNRFTPLDYDISKRPRTKMLVEWTPAPWKTGELYESPDCTEIVQAIINKADWKSGNAMAFIINGNGSRAATAYDGNFYYAPKLKIQYRKQSDLSNLQ